MAPRKHVLIVEDDTEIGGLLSEQLRELGYRVDWVMDGKRALTRFRENNYGLVILDLMLPAMDGLEVCRHIRETDRRTPILMLTAKAALSDVVQGLEVGADDYMTKPFHTAELLARVRALLRRSDGVEGGALESPGQQTLVRGSLVIDPLKHRVELRGHEVALTAKEFALLLTFARQPGRIFSRGELLSAVWGTEFEGYDHTVNTHINRLRNKIEDDPSTPHYIRTAWGVGYRFAELDELIG